MASVNRLLHVACAALVVAASACSTASGPSVQGTEGTSTSSSSSSRPSPASRTATATPAPTQTVTPTVTPTVPATVPATVTPRVTATVTATGTPTAEPFDVAAVRARIEVLAAIGPRDAASTAYEKAVAYVHGELSRLGYSVERQRFRVPAGVSWGVRVPAGDTSNVVADPPGFDATRPHVVLGAHLDTVPQAPGAEDNASGVAVMTELARMLRDQPLRLPVRIVAFAAEEARGGNGTRYAFGSRHFVAGLTQAERAAVVAMVSLDRVGVRSSTVPVCSGGKGTTAVADALRRASHGVVATAPCRNRASDHVSFEAARIPAARIGSVPYAADHSSRDVPAVIDDRQLGRVGAVLWRWLPTAAAP